MSSELKPPAPAKPPRSPVERAIVWGVIGIGLLVIAVEANAHLSHTAALGKLRSKLDETADVNTGLTKKQVDQIVGNKIPESQKLGFLDTSIAASRVDIYTYPALLRSRKLYIYYGIDGKLVEQEAEVMDVLTVVAPTAAEAQASLPPMDPNAKFDGPEGGVAGRGGPGGPGSGTGGGTGGGRRKGKRNAEGGASGRPKTEDADTKPSDDKPKTDDAKPADDTKPATDAKPEEAKPEAAKPEPVKPEPEKPAADKPAETKPEETKPAETEPKKE
ncbi:MAG: hypothetical protein JWN70_4420 [Planctomycetaceae bacterium]|nr:hypothetical protein [Planctomycetaceae bacterium]